VVGRPVTASLSGRLPTGEANGLGPIVAQLVDDPGAVHVLVALVDAVKVTQLVESGDVVPTLRIRRIEAITDPADRKSMQRLLMREYERRTGQPVLPLALEEDVTAAFAGTPDADDAGPGDDDGAPPRKRRRRP
jgi:hypothetical protein